MEASKIMACRANILLASLRDSKQKGALHPQCDSACDRAALLLFREQAVEVTPRTAPTVQGIMQLISMYESELADSHDRVITVHSATIISRFMEVAGVGRYLVPRNTQLFPDIPTFAAQCARKTVCLQGKVCVGHDMCIVSASYGNTLPGICETRGSAALCTVHCQGFRVSGRPWSVCSFAPPPPGCTADLGACQMPKAEEKRAALYDPGKTGPAVGGSMPVTQSLALINHGLGLIPPPPDVTAQLFPFRGEGWRKREKGGGGLLELSRSEQADWHALQQGGTTRGGFFGTACAWCVLKHRSPSCSTMLTFEGEMEGETGRQRKRGKLAADLAKRRLSGPMGVASIAVFGDLGRGESKTERERERERERGKLRRVYLLRDPNDYPCALCELLSAQQ
ncbi:hypothetical protein JZ751_023023 [Albula glossodonta]|uniref:Uncharacterized protein n=1 Tax=Albula glossodonta TaxID=121402 RepID=A0A8T2PML4_9TELE|nr:hypothetical protein JZ751_023023 [Albula glossodonta]